MSNLVFVLDTEKRPLLPIHPGKAQVVERRKSGCISEGAVYDHF